MCLRPYVKRSPGCGKSHMADGLGHIDQTIRHKPYAISQPGAEPFVGQPVILCYETIRIESFLSHRSPYGIVQKPLPVFTPGRLGCIPPGKAMKAIVLKEFGGPEVLRLEDVPTAVAGEGEILLKVHSVSVNRTLDLVVRQGEYPVKVQLPHGGGEINLDVKRLYARRLRVIGAAGTNLPDVNKALEAANEGKICPIIDRTLPLRQAAEAHRIVERNQMLGKIILDPTQN
jgi:hypothetical protein